VRVGELSSNSNISMWGGFVGQQIEPSVDRSLGDELLILLQAFDDFADDEVTAIGGYD